MVLLQNVHLRLVIVSAHAPDSTKGEEVVTAFWTALAKLITKHAQHDPVVLGIDGNQQLLSVVGNEAGGIGCDEPGKYAHFVHEAVQKTGLYLPATFEQCSASSTSQPTFSARGAATQNDYIAVSHGVLVKPGSSTVWDDLNTGGLADDHLPALTTVQAVRPNRQHLKKQRSLIFDIKKLDDPECCKEFESAVHQRVRCAFTVEPSTHLHVLTQCIQTAVKTAFPLVNTTPKKEHVTPETYQLIVQKGKLMKIQRRNIGHIKMRWYTQYGATGHVLQDMSSPVLTITFAMSGGWYRKHWSSSSSSMTRLSETWM